MMYGNPFHVAEQRDAGRSPSHLVRQLYNQQPERAAQRSTLG